MKERIKLLNIMVDIASTEVAGETALQCLNEESSKSVYFVNSETLLLLQENEDWKNTVEESELVLPGNPSVNSSIDEMLGYKRDSFFVEGFLDAVLDRAVEMGYEFMLVAEDEEKFTFIQENIHEKRPFLTLSGMFLTEQEESLGHIVNEINSVAPDILLVALEEKKQVELLQQFRNQMNVGLMLFAGDILYDKAVLEAEVPGLIQKLRIQNLYKWLRRERRIKVFWDNLKMKIVLKRRRREK